MSVPMASAEIERVFEAKVKPGTIKERARRMEIGTNVPLRQRAPRSPQPLPEEQAVAELEEIGRRKAARGGGEEVWKSCFQDRVRSFARSFVLIWG